MFSEHYKREELEQTKACPVEIPEINVMQNMIEPIAETNTKLEEILEKQKKILEEIKKNRTE